MSYDTWRRLHVDLCRVATSTCCHA
ncbi:MULTISPECIES: putative leader peptide [unclassified Rhodococcus (in: high G+C Gram-positive bacteria)]